MQFSEFIKANVRLYELRNNRSLSTSAIANFIRNELANALRQACWLLSLAAAPVELCLRAGPSRAISACVCSRAAGARGLTRGCWPQRPYQTNLLIAGHDKGKGASLFWCDYLATMHRMNVAGTGYGACSAWGARLLPSPAAC